MKPPPSHSESTDPPGSPEPSEEVADDSERERQDQATLGRLSAALDQADPPPEGLDDIAMRALTWDVELGHLASAIDEEPVLVRDRGTSQSSGQPLQESFQVDDYAIDLTIESGQVGVLLRGIVTPRVEQVFLTGPSFGPQPVNCDEFGRFEADVELSTVAVEFVGSDDLARRTPLLDL